LVTIFLIIKMVSIIYWKLVPDLPLNDDIPFAVLKDKRNKRLKKDPDKDFIMKLDYFKVYSYSILCVIV
jgi:hypothetical protein